MVVLNNKPMDVNDFVLLKFAFVSSYTSFKKSLKRNQVREWHPWTIWPTAWPHLSPYPTTPTIPVDLTLGSRNTKEEEIRLVLQLLLIILQFILLRILHIFNISVYFR
jgi:hypothetical protein